MNQTSAINGNQFKPVMFETAESDVCILFYRDANKQMTHVLPISYSGRILRRCTLTLESAHHPAVTYVLKCPINGWDLNTFFFLQHNIYLSLTDENLQRLASGDVLFWMKLEDNFQT